MRSAGYKWLPMLMGLAITLAICVVQVAPPDGLARVFNRLNALVYDFRILFAPSPEYSAEFPIVFVDVDEASLEQHGRWPWSRALMAQLADNLMAGGALVVGFDVMFSEPERNPVDVVAGALGPVPEALQARLESVRPGLDADQQMATALSRGDFVLGFLLHREVTGQTGTATERLPPPAYPEPADSLPGLMALTMPAATANLEVLQKAALGGGFITTLPDFDGVLRRTPAVLVYNNQIYASLSVAMIQALLFEKELRLNTALLGKASAITSIEVADRQIPTDARGNVLVPWRRGQPGYLTIAASEVLSGAAGRGQLENALVIVGSSAIGLGDLVSTPVNPAMPGATVHARVLEAMLAGQLPYRPDWAPGAELAATAVIGLVLSVLLPLLAPAWMVVVALTCFALLVLVNGWLWAAQGLDIMLAPLLLMAAGLLLLNLFERLLRENRERRRIKRMFGEYVPDAHIDAMLEDPKAYNFSGDSREMTVLFSDIRGFTTISESLSAQALKTLLNRYFTPITRTIFEHEGTVDKYVGDMVMAFWGAPLEDGDHATHGVLAALSMLEITAELREAFRRDGLPEIHIGVGINTGVMSVGDMGSSYRRAYTVLGDAVNLGARLESITKFYGARLLVGPGTREQARGVVFMLVDKIIVKGKHEAVRVYEPLGLEGEVPQAELNAMEQHHAALEAYYHRDWASAEGYWQPLAEAWPDKRLYTLYLERLALLRTEPPPRDWDGTFVHSSK